MNYDYEFVLGITYIVNSRNGLYQAIAHELEFVTIGYINNDGTINKERIDAQLDENDIPKKYPTVVSIYANNAVGRIDLIEEDAEFTILKGLLNDLHKT